MSGAPRKSGLRNLAASGNHIAYSQLAEITDGVWFGGRLAEYRYYDMAPTIESAINLFNKLNRNV